MAVNSPAVSTFALGSDAVPAEQKVLRRSPYSDAERASAVTVLAAWKKAGPQADYATARAAHLVIGEATGQPFTDRASAQKAGARVRSLIEAVMGKADTSGRLIVVTGKHPKSPNAFTWGMYFGPYEAPKPRKPKATAETVTVTA